MSTKLSIRTERDSYAPGETVSGTVQLLESSSARALLLTLEYRDWTSDYRFATQSLSLPGPLATGDLQQGASYPFSFALPSGALPNQTGGQIGSAGWGLHARIDKRGVDSHAWQVVNVSAPPRR